MLIVLSNLAYLLPSAVHFAYRQCVYGILFVAIGFFSSVFHYCSDVSPTPCFVSFKIFDFAFANVLVSRLTFLICHLSVETEYACLFLNLVSLLCLLGFYSSYAEFTTFAWSIVFNSWVLFFAYWRDKTNVHSLAHMQRFPLFLFSLVVAVETIAIYWISYFAVGADRLWSHSLWHVLSGIIATTLELSFKS